jgi:hypothetical protein
MKNNLEEFWYRTDRQSLNIPFLYKIVSITETMIRYDDLPTATTGNPIWLDSFLKLESPYPGFIICDGTGKGSFAIDKQPGWYRILEDGSQLIYAIDRADMINYGNLPTEDYSQDNLNRLFKLKFFF